MGAPEYVDESVGVSIHAGFPNAADDTRLQTLSLEQLLVAHPHSTYYFRVAGNQWTTSGIFDGDIALVDKAYHPRRNDLVVWWRGAEFAVSTFAHLPEHAEVWGVITTTIHQHRKAIS
jgi:SOS-response transcriptional repressor LexA